MKPEHRHNMTDEEFIRRPHSYRPGSDRRPRAARGHAIFSTFVDCPMKVQSVTVNYCTDCAAKHRLTLTSTECKWGK